MQARAERAERAAERAAKSTQGRGGGGGDEPGPTADRTAGATTGNTWRQSQTNRDQNQPKTLRTGAKHKKPTAVDTPGWQELRRKVRVVMAREGLVIHWRTGD